MVLSFVLVLLQQVSGGVGERTLSFRAGFLYPSTVRGRPYLIQFSVPGRELGDRARQGCLVDGAEEKNWRLGSGALCFQWDLLQRWACGQERDMRQRLSHTGGSHMACPRPSSRLFIFNLSVFQCYLL